MTTLDCRKCIVVGFLFSTPIAFGAGVTSLSVGDGLSCALFDNGSIKCWGAGTSGELGQGDANNRGDQAGAMGAALLPIAFGATSPPAIQISSGGEQSCAIFSDHTLKCWGSNANGQLGVGD